MKKISIIVPCYNEEEVLPFFYEEITEVSKKLKNYNLEILFVNDGSKDRTLSILRDYAKKDKRIRYVSFSRNFGKEAAIYAGFENVTGDFVALMDADLQDPPSLLPEMVSFIEDEDYDCVGTKRKDRKGENLFISFCSNMFYKIINNVSQTKMVNGARDYCLMKRCVVDEIIALKEYNRYYKGIFAWLGYETKWISYNNVERVAGKTTFGGFFKRFVYALDALTAFTTAPLTLSAIIGMIFCIVSFIAILTIIIKTLVFGDPVSGWPSTVSIIFFVSGIQLFCIGIIGQYLSKTYLEVKKRPIYIIKETEKRKK